MKWHKFKDWLPAKEYWAEWIGLENSQYKAEIINNYNGLDFCEKANEWFDQGWQYVDYLRIDNANGGYTPVMILKKED